MPVQFSKFPTEISKDELRLKVQKLKISGFARPWVRLTIAEIAGRILSSSDVLVKVYIEGDQIAYSHWRHGRCRDEPCVVWLPVGGPDIELDRAYNVFTIRA